MAVLQEVEQMVGDAVAANNRRLAAAAATGDAGAMASVYEDEARLLPPNADAIRGRDDIGSYWEAGIEMGLRRLELETLELQHTDGLAVEVGRCTYLMDSDDGKAPAETGKYVVVHRRQPDGSWRRAVEIFNWDAPVTG
jgi:uncharacterized protein (TIGR02246 family)